MRLLERHRSAVLTLAYSPDGRTLASGGSDGEIHLWDLVSGTVKQTLAHGEPLLSLAWSPDGRRLAAGASSGITLHDLSGGRSPYLAAGLGGSCAVAYSNRSDVVLLTGFLSRRIDVYGATDGRMRGDLTGFRHGILAIAHAPAAARLASAGDYGELIVWSTAHFTGQSEPEGNGRRTGLDFARLVGHECAVYGVAFSSGGLLASADKRGEIHLWNPPTFAARRILRGHKGVVRALAFLPDGRSVLSASDDGTIRQWDSDSGRQTTAWNWKLGSVHTVALAPDGMTAAAAGADGTILVWDLD
jgi:WD40 repeat protein